MRQRLDRHPNFAGTAVFHAASVYNAPLLRLVSGRVVDEAGKDLPGVEIRAGGVEKRSNKCGKFLLRGVPEGQAELILEKEGFPHAGASHSPGRTRPDPGPGNIVLEKSE